MSELKPNSFMLIKEDGRVLVRGGLIFFSRGPFVNCEGKSPIQHEFSNNICIGSLPRWWQVIKWYRVIRMIKNHMEDEK